MTNIYGFHFLRPCALEEGSLSIGKVRRITVVTGSDSGSSNTTSKGGVFQ